MTWLKNLLSHSSEKRLRPPPPGLMTRACMNMRAPPLPPPPKKSEIWGGTINPVNDTPKKTHEGGGESRLTFVEYPQCGEYNPISLLEEKRHPVAANQRHPVSAFRDGYISLLRQDILKIWLALRLVLVAEQRVLGCCRLGGEYIGSFSQTHTPAKADPEDTCIQYRKGIGKTTSPVKLGIRHGLATTGKPCQI